MSLEDYVQHKKNCHRLLPEHSDGEHDFYEGPPLACTCGLNRALAAQEQPTRAQVEQLRKQGLLECRPNFKYGYNTAIRDVLALFPKEDK